MNGKIDILFYRSSISLVTLQLLLKVVNIKMYIYVHTIKKFNKEYFNTYLKLFENHNSTFTVFYVKKITIIFFGIIKDRSGITYFITS